MAANKFDDLLKNVGDDPVAIDYALFPKSYPLVPHQRQMVRTLDNPYVMFCWLEAARGMSKSYTAARYLDQACIRIPKLKVVFSGPSFRQSQTPFKYALEVLEENELVSEVLAKPPTMSNIRWEMVFKNGSKMIALPASAEKLHGERANIIMFEEFFDYPEMLHNKTVKPMLAVQSNRKVANKAIYVTSAEFQFRWAYKRRGVIETAAKEGDKRYAFMSYTIDQMPPPSKGGFYSLDQLDDDRRSMPPDIFRQQYYNHWLSDSGTFYVLSVMADENLRNTRVELVGDPTATYVMGVDVARSLRGAGDDSAISIWKMGDPDALVNLQVFNNITMEALADEIIRYLEAFPTTNRIVLDYGGGGVNVRDSLYKKGIVEVDELDPSIPGRRILQRFPNTPETITNAHYTHRGGFETKRLSLPAMPDDGDEDKERVVNCVNETLHELANIESKTLTSGFFSFDVPSGQKKDRAYAMMYGYWGCQQLKERRRIEEAAAFQSQELSDFFDPMAELF